MLHFGMNMPFILMMFYGSVMILIVLLFRTLLKKKLPKFVFPILWCVVLVRLLVPISLSSPLSIKVSGDSPLSSAVEIINAFGANIADTVITTYNEAVTEDITAGTASVTEPVKNLVISNSKLNTASQTTAIEDFIYESPQTSITAGTGTETSMVAYDYLNAYAEDSGLLYVFRRFSLQAVYCIGFLLTLGILLFQKYRYSLRLKNSLLIEHNETINALLREMDMGHILVFTNDEIASPLTCGLLAPRIYLPTRMDFQNRELLRHILMHETMHIRHKDNLVKTFMLTALVLNWFNPLVWLMAKYLAADLETACDEAVLKHCQDEDERKSYAFSLLAMAITGSRTALLYSAFSKTEVEKRIQSILHYRKASAILLIAAVAFMTCSTVAFATCAQAPFSPYLTSTCASDGSRWGVKVYTTRDLTLGKDAQKRAEDIVFNVLRTDNDSDPIRMDEEMRTALSDEFHVEKSAFRTDFFLCLNDEELIQEYAQWELVRDESGFYQYKGESVRIFADKMIGRYHSRSEGVVDVTVERDRFGYITEVRTQRAGDEDYDRHTEQYERNRTYPSVAGLSNDEATAIEYAQ
ncbi:MAG: M56 family metallopeptidase [Lachnospiraceae bacterium]|nr:M56 family metallopeptidase [Lachnospiraceae bacterium]